MPQKRLTKEERREIRQARKGKLLGTGALAIGETLADSRRNLYRKVNRQGTLRRVS